MHDPNSKSRADLPHSLGVKYKNPIYGQLVVGPPGSGKTTYCHYANNFYKRLGRKMCMVNLDPGNENMQYKPDVDVMELITVEDVMEHYKLGPNGALIHCIEFLLEHVEDWLLTKLRMSSGERNYFLFDCPGQVELYTHHNAMSKLFARLNSEGYHLVTVNLIESHYCSEVSKFVSILLMSLSMMLRMNLPHVNVLSKADQLSKFEAQLPFNMDFYTDVINLDYLIEILDDTPSMAKYRKLNAAICGLVQDYSLVTFQLLHASNEKSMLRLRNVIDKANGYIYRAGEEQDAETMMAFGVGAESYTKRHAEDIDPYIQHIDDFGPN